MLIPLIAEEMARMNMKRMFTIVIRLLPLLIGSFLFQSNSYADATNCPDGMAGYWKLDETSGSLYVDEIMGNNAACTAGCPVWVTGVFGNSQRFDGAEAIAVAADSALNWSASEDFTVELWVNRSTEGFSDDFEALVGRSGGSLQWYIGINSSGHAQALLTASDGSGPSAPLIADTDLRNNTETWHHVVLVRDAEQGRTTLYVDGEPAASQQFTYSAGFASRTVPITMGALNGDRFFNGALDEIAIYDRALGENEIKSHYYVPRSYCARHDAPVGIMPLGDSITLGIMDGTTLFPSVQTRIAYRYDLWQLLENNLFWFDFIGSQSAGYGYDASFDADHAGFGGIRDDQLQSLLATGINPVNSVDLTGGEPYLDAYPAEIILLHIGTNGLNTSPDDVKDILDQIDAFSQNVTVLLAKIIDQVPHNGTVTTFNQAVETMVLSRVAQGDKIILVDMESGASLIYALDSTDPYTSGDMYDDLHPNPSGYNKMAIKWFETLDAILPQPDEPLIPPNEGSGGGGGGGCFIATLMRNLSVR